ncbi:MAG: hypothetical protein A2W95_15410 [Bacteroidetes bacterium GWA2_40_14]|jgi:hypothetical protein|nr:MAG: hypothetical protein A2W95_15410 [Bacteroidetes bacterium GWA2_40_14]HAZ02475.1 hypothetical protein [Marinilabiliales bacterium]
MSSNNIYTGFAIAIAWPQTYCKQPGAWYDPITLLLGINQNNYYKVGHAALVLIDSKNRKAHYFDFGRYHTPYQHGRVRSAETDHDLELKTTPVFSEDSERLENYWDILYELQNNAACHGEGELYASYCPIHFEPAFAKAKQMQENSPIPYGPFKINGSNCSRFVNTAIRAGKPGIGHWFRLNFKVPLSPKPISNVNALDNRLVLPKLSKGELFYPLRKLDKQLLIATLPAPERHPNIPENAQWLSGEGAGSWFVFEVENTLLKVIRYSPQGVIECTGLYENKDAMKLLQNHNSCSITYPSNCKTVSLKVNNSKVSFSCTV